MKLWVRYLENVAPRRCTDQHFLYFFCMLSHCAGDLSIGVCMHAYAMISQQKLFLVFIWISAALCLSLTTNATLMTAHRFRSGVAVVASHSMACKWPAGLLWHCKHCWVEHFKCGFVEQRFLYTYHEMTGGRTDGRIEGHLLFGWVTQQRTLWYCHKPQTIAATTTTITVINAFHFFLVFILQARTSDFDSSEYCNISAEDVKTEIVSFFLTTLRYV